VSGGSDNALEIAASDANQNMGPAPAGSPVRSCGLAPTPDTTISSDKKHWIAIDLVDEEGERVPYEDYRIVLPDGTPVEGTLDEKGRARINGIDSGTCKVSFPNRDTKDWKRL
jgi:hypothetical protein